MIFTRFVTLLLLLPAIAMASGIEMPSRPFFEGDIAPKSFRAPYVAPVVAVSLAAPAKAAAVADIDGRRKIGDVRALEKSVPIGSWVAVDGGYVARLVAKSDTAAGLSVKLALGTLPGALEMRVQGSGERIESAPIDPSLGTEAWTPWTEGDSQVIELFSAIRPSPGAVRIESVVHFADTPFAKAASSCTLPVVCPSGDTQLDVALAERKKSVARLLFVDGGSSFVCTTTLINTEKFPAAYILTANHCINNATSAASLSTFWFYENSICGSDAVNPAFVQVSGGGSIVFANHNADVTLLLMNRNPPSGVVYSSWNAALLNTGDAIVSVSNPKGDTTRYALGNIAQQWRIVDYPYDMYGVAFTRGIIEGGSSGSGLFTMAGGSLQLRGILSGSTVMSPGGLSCTNLADQGLYTRLEVIAPEIAPYISLNAPAADDAPNRPQDLFSAPFSDPTGVDLPLDQRTSALVFANRRIDYAGDQDVYRFRLSVPATVTVGTTGTTDTVGMILDSNGLEIVSNDDVANGNTNFGITQQLAAGTYYVQVANWDPNGTGTYSLSMSAITSGDNYTDLWWNASESGWGVNVNHQGDILFATLFTYDTDGTPMWLVMSDGARQPNTNNFSGTLYRTTGTPFNAQTFAPIGPANYTAVGTMRFQFASGGASGTMVYNVGANTVSKNITRNMFATHPTCTFTLTDRSAATNYQDLWYNANESGWGVNVTHQGDTLFATLFIYDSNSQGTWLVMSNGAKTGTGTYTGTLYRTTGPAYNASPFTPIGPGNYTAVGTMTFTFATGNRGTLQYTVNGSSVTKLIQRLVISTPTTLCTP